MLQSGIFVHNTLNTHRVAGVGSKDVSLGVPRFVELLNNTKPENQKKGSCTIYFDKDIIIENALKTMENPEGEEEDLECNEFLNEMKHILEETTVNTFYDHCELRYLPDSVNLETDASPSGILTFEQYEKRWWVELSEKMGRHSNEIVAESWVLILFFNVEKLYEHRIGIDELSKIIEEASEGKYYCIASPTVIGQIEIYFNFTEIREYALNKDNEKATTSFVNEKNIDYFACKEYIGLGYLLSIPVSGVCGIDKVFQRRDHETQELFLDASSSKITAKKSNNRLMTLLALPGVDSTRTISDDVWAIQHTLGVEAVRNFLIQEMTRVISFDGTYINARHMQVLVDSMTVSGVVTSVSRNGINRDTVGPIEKITFEQPIKMASTAAAFGETDHVDGISASVVFGFPGKTGTGVVEVVESDNNKPKLLAPPVLAPLKTRERVKSRAVACSSK